MSAPGRFSIEHAARQWHALAERRVAAYIELYRSGRWRHYYSSQEEFAARMLDVIKVARTFQRLAGVPPTDILAAAQEGAFRNAA